MYVCVCACAHVSTHAHFTTKVACLVFVIAVQGAWLLSLLWRGVRAWRTLVYARASLLSHALVFGMQQSRGSGYCHTCGVVCVCVCVRLVQGHMPGICLRVQWVQPLAVLWGVACMPQEVKGSWSPPPMKDFVELEFMVMPLSLLSVCSGLT